MNYENCSDTFPVHIRLQIKVDGCSILVTVPGSDWSAANVMRKQPTHNHAGAN